MSKRKLFIDGQVFQSAAWDRGMGKYSLALIRNMLPHKDYQYDEAYIIFSANIPLSDEVQRIIREAAPSLHQVVYDLEVPEDPCTADIPKMQARNQKILGTELASLAGGETYDFLILSLFIDQVCIVFPEEADRKILLFYDLIPIQYVERYSQLCAFPNYLKRFKVLFEADIFWTISQTVADDLTLNLGIDPVRIVNIDGGPIDRSKTKPQKPKIDISKRFILMPSGDDLRKNNVRAVQGFEEYRRRTADDIQLVITSHFNDLTRNQLKAYSEHIVFSGNVSEAELQWLYESAEAMLFVTEYEGLGLPVLEAAEVKKPIICSNIGVFNEISTEAFYYCNHLSPTSISEAIQEALTDDPTDKVKLYPGILKRYSWQNTTTHALASLAAYQQPVTFQRKPRLAVLAPSPGTYSAISKRVAEMHPTLSEYFDADYYVEYGKTTHKLPRVDYLPAIANVYPAASFTKDTYQQYDAVLYHIGNSEFHVETIKSGLYLPGFAIIHDTQLAGIFEGELSTYEYISKDRFSQEKLLDEQLKNEQTSFLTSLANRQLGIIAHSDFTKEAVNHTLIKDVPVTKVNLPVGSPKNIGYKLPNSQLTIGFAGIIHPAKGLDIIEQVAQDPDLLDCKIHIFGLSLVSDDVIRRLQSYPNVTIDLNVSDFEFQTMLREVDVLVNYRKDYKGETSAATLDAMCSGTVSIVRKIGWYDELPDDVVMKAKTPADVLIALKEFASWAPEDRRALAERAHRYATREHTYAAYAQHLYEHIKSESGRGPNSAYAALVRKGASKGSLVRPTKATE